MPLMLFYREGSEGTEKQPAQENIPTNGGTRIPTKETPLSTVPVPQCYPPFLLHSVYVLGLTDPVITGLSGCLGVPTSLTVQHSPSPFHPTPSCYLHPKAQTPQGEENCLFMKNREINVTRV